MESTQNNQHNLARMYAGDRINNYEVIHCSKEPGSLWFLETSPIDCINKEKPTSVSTPGESYDALIYTQLSPAGEGHTVR